MRPDEKEIFLVKAAVLKDAWAYDKWRETVDLNQINPGEARMVPLLYRNLELKDDKLKGIVKHFWVRNQLLFSKAVPILERLTDEGVTFSLLKGAAVSLLIYQDLGIRPMEDIDILVPKEEIQLAVSTLEDSGFASQIPFQADYFDYRHSLGFEDHNGCRVDLHAYILEDCCKDHLSHPFQVNTTICKYRGFHVNVPMPTELLYQTIAHGTRWNQTSPIRWIADAYAIIKKSSLDWNKLASYVERYEVITAFRHALDLLRGEFKLPIPQMRFDAQTAASRDQRKHAFHSRPYNSLCHSIIHHWDHFKQTGIGDSFPVFCRKYWNLASVRELPYAALEKLRKKFSRKRPF